MFKFLEKKMFTMNLGCCFI